MDISQIFYCLAKTRWMSNAQKDLEILALRSQLAVVQQLVADREIRPRVNDSFRRLWVYLSTFLVNWKATLVIVKPETVIGWHRKAFQTHWRRKTQGGRPKISGETIALINRIHKENPTLSPEKIHERLLGLNISDAPAPNTIAKYIRIHRVLPTEKQKQSWQTFLRNHAKDLWAMDFAVVPTLAFKQLYVLLIVSHDRRRIEHCAVTAHPTALWLIQQIRNATALGYQPKYLLHDNGQPFKDTAFQQFLANIGIKSKSITPYSPWQNGICERLVGIVRRELLDHIIPLNQRHLERLLTEYVEYYNNVRTHQTLGGETPVESARPPLTLVKDTKLKAKPILGGLYHDYEKAA